ncbi:MAG: hypothetical protein Q9162_001465 [Coniocarpon cinnabarinum]
MNVERNTFFDHLPTILKRISNAHFIAFDLELSGIPERGKTQHTGRPSLQGRYDELKAAAEKYQILQVGLTVVEEDRENDRYLIRPFNFNLSPLVEDERNVVVERDFTYSSSAVNFLRNQGYDMGSPFSTGVPYLTRQEADQAWQRARKKFDRRMIPDIQVPATDIQATRFMARVRREISAWQKTTKGTDHIEITGQIDDEGRSERMLNRFEKRLVHQIVRADFTSLETFSLLNTVKVKHKGVDSVDQDQEPWRRQAGEAICLQTGFRWVAEAIGGGNLDDLDPFVCGRRIAGEPDAPTRPAFRSRMKRLIQDCVQRPKILVGHNCFIDIIYLFKLFYGDLPDDVNDFKAAVHARFPLLLDTKFMVTAGFDSNRFRGSNLSEVDQIFEWMEAPDIYGINDHPQYGEDDQSFHEAGFDSYITAKVFLRLAASFQAIARGERAESLFGRLNMGLQPKQVKHAAGRDPVEDLNKEQQKATPEAENSLQNMGHDAATGSTTEPSRKRYASTNVFDTLSDADMAAASKAVEGQESPSTQAKAQSTKSLQEDVEALRIQDDERPEAIHATQQEQRDMLPGWEADFWVPFRNKLRVYGTIEEVCILGNQKTNGLNEQGHRPINVDEPKSLWQQIRAWMS